MSKARSVLEVHALSKIIATLESMTPTERARTLRFVNDWASALEAPAPAPSGE